MKTYEVIIRMDPDGYDVKVQKVRAESLSDVRRKYFGMMAKRKADNIVILKDGSSDFGGLYFEKGFVRWANAEKDTPANNYVSPITGRLVMKESYLRDVASIRRRY